MAIEFIQLNTATTSGARLAADVVTGAAASDAVYYQTVQLVKGADAASKTLITSGAGLPVYIDSAATVGLAGGTATVGSVHLAESTATITLSALPAGTATIGVVGLSSGVLLVGGTATIGSVNLTSPSGASLTTDGVLKVQVSEATATYTLGAGTATIGSVVLSSASGGSLTTDGRVKVSDLFENTISTNNSTTSTLANDATYTGTADDVSNHASVTVQLDSSHDSSTDGMTFQFSTDNSNWDDVYSFTYTAADGARRFQFPVTAQYFRIVYTNGGVTQTHFRVQTILHSSDTHSSVHRLVDDTGPDRSANLVKAAIIAQKAGTGDLSLVQSTAAGNLKAAIEEFDASLPAGTATIGVVGLSSGVVLAAGTASIGIVQISESTATTVLGGSTATIGTVLLNTASGGSLTTDGVLKTDAGTPVLAAGTATVGSVHVSESTATYTIGPGTSTIGVVGLSSGVVIAAGTASIGIVKISESTATTVLGGSTATIGRVGGFFTTTGGAIEDGTNDALRVNIVAGAAAGGTSQTDKAALTSGSTAYTPVGGWFQTAVASDRDVLTASQGGIAAMSAYRAVFMVPETASGGSLTTDGALKTDSGNPVIQSGTATIGSVIVSETTATYTLGGGTATIGTVILNTASGGSLTTDGVLKTDAGTPVLGAGTATVGFVRLSESTATTVLGGSTATIGTVLLNTASGGSLTTDGVLKTDAGTPVLGAGTATVGSVHVAETTATYVLGGGTATIGTVILNTASGGSLTTDGVLKTDAGTPVLAAGTATIGSILNLNTLVQTTATFVLGGSTATIGTVLLNTTTGGSLSTDGDLRVRLTQTTATTVLGPGTATVGSVILGAGTATIGAIAGFFTTTGGSLTTDGVLKTDAGTPVIAAGTATIGSVIVSETTATYVLGGGTATIGTVILNTVSGGSLTTDGVLKTDAGTPVLAAGTATIGSILNLNTLVQTTATFILGGGTATIGTVLLNTSTGGSLSTDGDLRVRLTQSTATTVLGPGTATIGRLGPNTATIGVVGLSSGVVLQAGTATIGSVNLTSPSGNSLTTDGVLLTQLAPGSAAIGTVQITQTTATTVLGGSTATIGSVVISNAVDPFEDQDAFVLASGEGAVVFGFVTTDGSVATGQVGAMKMAPTRELYTIAADRTDAIHGHNISYTPKFAVIETTASNSTQVVAGVASKRIRVLNGFLISSAGANVEFRSTSNAANNLTGLIQLATTGGSGWCMPHSPVGWFQATAGGALYIYSDSAVNIGGAITYIEAS